MPKSVTSLVKKTAETNCFRIVGKALIKTHVWALSGDENVHSGLYFFPNQG